MKITISIETDNAAFEDHAGVEVKRILTALIERIEDWPGQSAFEIGLRDINGNKVGTAEAK